MLHLVLSSLVLFAAPAMASVGLSPQDFSLIGMSRNHDISDQHQESLTNYLDENSKKSSIISHQLHNNSSQQQEHTNSSNNEQQDESLISDGDQISREALDLNAFEAAKLGLFRHSLGICLIIFIAYTLVFIVGIVGNCFVVTIVCRSPKMRTVTNIFIANLALADILVLIICLPANLMANIFVPWVLGLFVCKAVSYLQGVAVSASINTMLAVTLDRFCAICFPMGFHLSRRNARWTIAGIWAFSLSIALPWAIVFGLKDFEHQEYYDTGQENYTLKGCQEIWPEGYSNSLYFIVANLIMLYLLPATIMLACYTGILIKLKYRSIPGDRPLDETTGKDPKIELIMNRSKLKVVKMMMVVMSIFLASWGPLYFIFYRIKVVNNMFLQESEIMTALLPVAQWRRPLDNFLSASGVPLSGRSFSRSNTEYQPRSQSAGHQSQHSHLTSSESGRQLKRIERRQASLPTSQSRAHERKRRRLLAAISSAEQEAAQRRLQSNGLGETVGDPLEVITRGSSHETVKATNSSSAGTTRDQLANCGRLLCWPCNLSTSPRGSLSETTGRHDDDDDDDQDDQRHIEEGSMPQGSTRATNGSRVYFGGRREDQAATSKLHVVIGRDERNLLQQIAGRDSYLVREIRNFKHALRYDEANRRERLARAAAAQSNNNNTTQTQQEQLPGMGDQDQSNSCPQLSQHRNPSLLLTSPKATNLPTQTTSGKSSKRGNLARLLEMNKKRTNIEHNDNNKEYQQQAVSMHDPSIVSNQNSLTSANTHSTGDSSQTGSSSISKRHRHKNRSLKSNSTTESTEITIVSIATNGCQPTVGAGPASGSLASVRAPDQGSSSGSGGGGAPTGCFRLSSTPSHTPQASAAIPKTRSCSESRTRGQQQMELSGRANNSRAQVACCGVGSSTSSSTSLRDDYFESISELGSSNPLKSVGTHQQEFGVAAGSRLLLAETRFSNDDTVLDQEQALRLVDNLMLKDLIEDDDDDEDEQDQFHSGRREVISIHHHNEIDDDDDDNMLFGSPHTSPERKPNKRTNDFDLHELGKRSKVPSARHIGETLVASGSSLVEVVIRGIRRSVKASSSVKSNKSTVQDNNNTTIIPIETDKNTNNIRSQSSAASGSEVAVCDIAEPQSRIEVESSMDLITQTGNLVSSAQNSQGSSVKMKLAPHMSKQHKPRSHKRRPRITTTTTTTITKESQLELGTTTADGSTVCAIHDRASPVLETYVSSSGGTTNYDEKLLQSSKSSQISSLQQTTSNNDQPDQHQSVNNDDMNDNPAQDDHPNPSDKNTNCITANLQPIPQTTKQAREKG